MQARTLVKRRLRELKPVSRELGCVEALARIELILEKGTGAERQEQVWNANRDVSRSRRSWPRRRRTSSSQAYA